MKTASVKI